jgi:hypothetical protein
MHPDPAPGTPDLSGRTECNAAFCRINPAFRASLVFQRGLCPNAPHRELFVSQSLTFIRGNLDINISDSADFDPKMFTGGKGIGGLERRQPAEVDRLKE